MYNKTGHKAITKAIKEPLPGGTKKKLVVEDKFLIYCNQSNNFHRDEKMYKEKLNGKNN